MNKSIEQIRKKVTNNLSIENLVFSGGGGFLFGAAAGYVIKKVMKIATIVIGLYGRRQLNE